MKPTPAELKLQRDRARKDSANLATALDALQAWGPMEGMRKLAALALREHRAFLLEEGRKIRRLWRCLPSA